MKINKYLLIAVCFVFMFHPFAVVTAQATPSVVHTTRPVDVGIRARWMRGYQKARRLTCRTGQSPT